MSSITKTPSRLSEVSAAGDFGTCHTPPVSSSPKETTPDQGRQAKFSSSTQPPIVMQHFEPLHQPNSSSRLPKNQLIGLRQFAPNAEDEEQPQPLANPIHRQLMEPSLDLVGDGVRIVTDFLHMTDLGDPFHSILHIAMILVHDMLRTGVPWHGIRATLHRIMNRRSTNNAITLPPMVSLRTHDTPVLLHVENIVGIPNLGETCFLNSVLQALASLEPFISYLERLAQVNEDLRARRTSTQLFVDSPESSSGACFTREILKFLLIVNGTCESPPRRIDPRSILSRIGTNHKQFRNQKSLEQQDAQELLQALIGEIVSDAKLDAQSSSQDPIRFCSHNDKGNTRGAASMRNQHSTTHLDHETIPVREKRPESNESRCSDPAVDSTNVISEALSLSAILENINENEEISRGRKQTIVVDSVDMNGCDEKKQEDFELTSVSQVRKPQNPGPIRTPGEADHHRSTPSTGPEYSVRESYHLSKKQDSKSMQILQGSLSPATPSPLTGWLGSTLQCLQCKHVKPIQNAPFVDIPLIPSSIPRWLAALCEADKGTPAPNISPTPACSLEQCLADFTRAERVSDVECRSCSIRAELTDLVEEAMMLEGAIASTERRVQRKGGNVEDAVKYLQADLQNVNALLARLRVMDPDSDDEKANECQSLYEHGSTSEGQRKALVRCDAKKCMLLTRKPAILCCHIQRRYYDCQRNQMEKCIQWVEFPEELDVGPYCAYGSQSMNRWVAGPSKTENGCSLHENGQIPYRLRSVIEHIGNAHGGHYVTYRRNRVGQWHRVSDKVVTPVSWSKVRTCQAYMLLYEVI